MMGDVEKICVLCGQSCAGQVRIKNEKGQYAHRACVKAKQEQAAVVKPEPAYEDDSSDALGGGMDDLLGDDLLGDDLIGDIGIQGDSGGATMPCPGCGRPMDGGAVVCVGCGYNTQSGKSMSTKSRGESATGKIGGAAAGGAAAIGGLAAGPTLAFVGAVIGGLVGAVIWAAIAYFTGFEIGWIAIGVGVLVGIGAQLGGGTETTGGGMIVGVMAAVVALGAIAGGKYGASYMFVQNSLSTSPVSEQFTIDDVTDDWVLPRLVDEVCREYIDDGGEIEWDKQLYVEAAVWPEDYPREIEDMVFEKWDSLDGSQRMAFRRGVADEVGEGFSYRDIDEDWALSSMAYMVTSSMIESGDAIDWPNPNLAMESASWPEDYPEAIQTQTIERWDTMSPDEQMEYRAEIVRSANELRQVFTNAITQGSFIDRFMNPFSILFLILAMGAAYKIGYGD